MTGEGIVVSVFQNDAIVKISKSSACGHDCASCGACSNPTYEMTVNNPVGAKAGDLVLIESDTKHILGLSFLLYMLPVILLIVAAFLCEAYSLGWVGVLIFLCLTVLWLLVIRLANKKIKPKNVIVKILGLVPKKD